MADNIKCGNCLIGPDFYRGKQRDLFANDERLRINVFDWQVIGNRPYIFTRELLTPFERSYFASCYKLGWEKQNTFMLFKKDAQRPKVIRQGRI